MRYHLTPAKRLSLINQQTSSAGKDMEIGEHFCTVGGNADDAATVESSMETPQKIKNESTFQASNPSSENIS